jgi:hypothetical protein
MFSLRAFCLILLPFASQALELSNLALTYHHFQDYSVFPELGGAHADQGLELSMDIDLIGPMYWDNSIHYLTEGADSLYVGWNYRLGIHALKSLDLGFEHFSQHLIGKPELTPHFPLYDAVFVQWTIYSSGREPASLF